jgi:foldase protein PrsA
MTDRIISEETDIAAPESREETRRKALDRLIFQELAYEEAVRRGLRPEAASVDSALEQFMNRAGREKGYKDFLEKQSLTTADVRAQLERGLALRLITAREVTEKIKVSDEDVRKEYEQRKDQYVSPEKVNVTDVVFFLKLDDEASIKKAGEVMAAINADKDKNPWNLARDNAFVVRDLNIDKEKDPVLYEAARKLKEGELSGVLRTRDSLHIIQLTKYTPERQLPFEEVGYAIKGQMRSLAQKKRLEEWKQELRKDAKILLRDAAGQPGQTAP